MYPLFLAGLEALAAVGTAELALLSARNIFQWSVATEEGNLGPGRHQLNQVQRAFGYTQAAAVTLLRVNNDDVFFLIPVDGVLRVLKLRIRLNTKLTKPAAIII